MPLIPDKAAFQNSLASLPLVTYQPGETVIVCWFEDWPAADPQEGQCRDREGGHRDRQRWRSLAPYLVSSLSC